MGRVSEYSREARKALNFLASMPSGSFTLVKSDFRSLLLNSGGWMMARGASYDIKGTEIGAGVFRVMLLRRHA